jgi:hypothetical protein
MHCLRQSAKYIRINRTSGTTDGFIFTIDIRKFRSAGLLVNRTIKQRIKSDIDSAGSIQIMQHQQTYIQYLPEMSFS